MFRFGNSYLIYILLFYAIYSIFRGGFDIEGTLYTLPGLIIALTLHEFAHAKMADKLGDPTPENQGRLTLNPVAHMDPMGTICLLFAGFGWGKPVQINPSYFRQPVKDEAKVAAAGPIMNFIIAFVCTIIYAFIMIYATRTGIARLMENGNVGFIVDASKFFIIESIVLRTIIINISLGLFNLLPFPPLDGSKIFRSVLKGKAREFLYKMEDYSFIIIAILFFTSIPRILISPLYNIIISGLFNFANFIIGRFG